MVTVPLHRDVNPPAAHVVRSAVLANVLVFSLASVAFGLVPWLSGSKPEVTPASIGVTGVAAFLVTFGFLIRARRKFARKRAREGDAELRLGERIELFDRRQSRTTAAGHRDDVEMRLGHALESRGTQEYYVGPALTLGFESTRITIAALDGHVRWKNDPPSVHEIDWVCSPAAWRQLAEALDLTDTLTTDET